MTIELLKALSEKILSEAVEELSKTGSVDACFILMKRDGGRDIVATIDGSINSPQFKTSLARHIRERVAQGDIEAVAFVSDIFWANDLTPEAQRVRKMFGLNIEQSAAAGLCTLREAVMVQVESPILLEITQQEYSRTGKQIQLVGSPTALQSGENWQVLPSKMAGWFNNSLAGSTTGAKQ